MLIKLTLRTTKGNFCLPKLYYLPKLQQRSIKSRFILKVQKVLWNLYLQLLHLSWSYSIIKLMLLMGEVNYSLEPKPKQNSNPLAKAIKNLNKRNKVLSFSTYDTSDLFPKIRQYNNHLCRACLLCRTWNMEEYYIQN